MKAAQFPSANQVSVGQLPDREIARGSGRTFVKTSVHTASRRMAVLRNTALSTQMPFTGSAT